MIADPVVEKIDGIFVVRDDFIKGGTKRCFADKLIYGFDEVVYASPVYGGAQIALAYAAKELNINCTIFCAKRKDPHPRTLEAHNAGAKIVQVPAGYLSNVKAKAKTYCERTGAYLLPFGLETQLANKAIEARAKYVQNFIGEELDQVWSVAGSGVLIRGLNKGLKSKSFNVVQIGRKLSKSDVASSNIFIHPLDFSQDSKVIPPFPSCSNYDAKAWEYVKKYGNSKTLFWNVMK